MSRFGHVILTALLLAVLLADSVVPASCGAEVNSLPALSPGTDSAAKSLDRERSVEPHPPLAAAPSYAETFLNAETSLELRGALSAYRRLIDHELLLGHLSLIREIVFAFGLLAAVFGLTFLIWRETRGRRLVIEPFDVPPDFDARGWSGRVVARRLHDKLAYIHDHSATIFEKQRLARAGVDINDRVSIPGAHVSLSTVFAYIRSILGRDTVIEGELTREGEKVVVTVRTDGRSSASFSDDIEQLDAILSRAADQIMLVTQPSIAAVFRRNNGDTAGAAEALSRCVIAGNARVVGWGALTQGRMAQAAGDLEGAAARFETSIRASPMVAWAYESLIALRIDQGRWGAAEEVATRFYKATGRGLVWPRRKSEAYAVLGQVRFLMYDWDTAQKLFDRALRYDRRNPRARALVSLLLILRHDHHAALALAERNLRLPRHRLDEIQPAAFLGFLGRALLGLRDYEGARDLARQRLELYPTQLIGWTLMGLVCHATHQYDDAISHFRKALSPSPAYANDSDAYLADSLARVGRRGDAIEFIELSLATNPKDPPLLACWGNILLESENPEASIEKYRKALELLPTHSESHDGWGRALALTGNTSGAETRFKLAIKYAPKWSAPYLHWGEMLAARGEFDAATERYQQALNLDPRWCEPHAKLGAIHEARGDAASARAHYAIAISLDPGNPALISLKDKLTGQQAVA